MSIPVLHRLLYSSVKARTGFLGVYKIPSVHSDTEQEQLSCQSGYTVTQYSGHHASGIWLWETLLKQGGAEVRACGTSKRHSGTEQEWTVLHGVTMEWIWSGHTIKESQRLSGSECVGLSREVCDQQELHCTEDSGTLSPLIPLWRGLFFFFFFFFWSAPEISGSMAGVTRKGSGRPSYYYRFLGKSRLQRQRSRSRSRTRPSARRGN